MGEKEDKEKAEKLAAAKKRVAQLQKKKKASAGAGAGDKEKASTTGKGKAKDKDKDKEIKKEKVEDEKSKKDVEEEEDEDDDNAEEEATVQEKSKPSVPEASKADDSDADEDENAFNEVIKAAQKQNDEQEDIGDGQTSPGANNSTSAAPTASLAKGRAHPARQPSVSLQSKIRSASFRQGATPTSPGINAEDDYEFPDIYRKQMARIEELERENKRLAAEAQESRARWQKNEEELEEERERAAEGRLQSQKGNKDDDEGENEEILKLRGEIDMLRRGSRPSISGRGGKADEDVEELRKEVEIRDGTIGDLQLEISRLRAQASTASEGRDNENEQITALRDVVRRTEEINTKLTTELQDTKKALNRASEKAVVDGTERTSKDTKLRALERETEDLKSQLETSTKKVETLEKKIEALNKLHRDNEQRNAPKLASADTTLKDLQLTKAKLESSEKENLRLREARKHRMSGDASNEQELDDLEDEDRTKLERRIRDLEGENFDLRRGVWRDKRRELQPNLSQGGSNNLDGIDDGTNADDFDEVDLNGSGAATRKNSSMYPGAAGAAAQQQQARHSGFTQVFNSGLAAFRASTTSPDSSQKPSIATRPRNDSLLEDFDDDAFDEGAFAAAQKEEEMRKMIEHVREVKRGLKEWKGWRLDLVDTRRSIAGSNGAMGFGEVFEV